MINEPPEEYQPATGVTIRLEGSPPPPEPIYTYGPDEVWGVLLRQLIEPMQRSRALHERLAEEWGAAGPNLAAIADSEDRLAAMMLPLLPEAAAEFQGKALRWRLAAQNLTAIGQAHAQLAQDIPDAIQAAADLGAAAGTHGNHELAGWAKGALTLAGVIDEAQKQDHATLQTIKAQLQTAARERQVILAELGVLRALLSPPPEEPTP